MCGIAGEVAFSRPPDREAVRVMTTCLRDRGPDGQGQWADDRVALGHRRLSIIDLSDDAAQPMVDDTRGLALVFNGCIYNHRELRAELSDYPFRTASDTEVISRRTTAGARTSSTTSSACSPSCSPIAARAACSSCATASASSRSTSRRWTGRSASPRRSPRSCARVASTPASTASPSTNLSWHSIVPAPRTLLRGGAEARARHHARRGTRRQPTHPAVLVAPLRTRRGARAVVGIRLDGCRARVAAHRSRSSAHRGRAGRRPALGRARLEPHRGTARGARDCRAVRPGRRRGVRGLPLSRAGRCDGARRDRLAVPRGVRGSRRRDRRADDRRASSGLARCERTPPRRGAHGGRRGDGPRRRPAPRHPSPHARRPGEARRQHDDGVGRRGPRAVPGSRARRVGGRVPARAQVGRGGQGGAQEGRALTASGRGHRPTQGLLPGSGRASPRGRAARVRARFGGGGVGGGRGSREDGGCARHGRDGEQG